MSLSCKTTSELFGVCQDLLNLISYHKNFPAGSSGYEIVRRAEDVLSKASMEFDLPVDWGNG